MPKTDEGLTPILDYLLEKRGFDFSGYHPAMLARRIGQRLAATSCQDFGDYLSCLQQNVDELDRLLDVITINVSRFFRDTLTFELIAARILPDIIGEKTRARDQSLRVWSAGCARGEEPYSLAILIHELLRNEEKTGDTSQINQGASAENKYGKCPPFSLHLFATDIDLKALADAGKALYPREHETPAPDEIFHTGRNLLPINSRNHETGHFFALRHAGQKTRRSAGERLRRL
jgi:chemotaxis protein methyltransferase CheR